MVVKVKETPLVYSMCNLVSEKLIFFYVTIEG